VHDLYYLWQHLHYIWPRRAPHRPTRPGFSAGLLRALLLAAIVGVLKQRYVQLEATDEESKKALMGKEPLSQDRDSYGGLVVKG
jgi:hypothetical protein